MSLAAVRDLRVARAPVTAEDLAALGLRPLRDLSTPGSDQDERYNHR